MDKVETVIVVLFGSFFLEDDTGNEFVEAWGTEKHVSVSSSVLSGVLEIDSLELFLDGPGGFVGGEDTFAGCADFVCGLDEFFGEVFRFHCMISIKIFLYLT